MGKCVELEMLSSNKQSVFIPNIYWEKNLFYLHVISLKYVISLFCFDFFFCGVFEFCCMHRAPTVVYKHNINGVPHLVNCMNSIESVEV